LNSEGVEQKSKHENAVRWLYQQFLEWWNERNAAMMVALCTNNANLIGFDGSQMNGRAEINSELTDVFSRHKTGFYVWKINEVKMLTSAVAVLRAVAGMVPAGKSDIEPKVNAVQTMVAVKNSGTWSIELFQNTPAAFDDAPELREKLSNELRTALSKVQTAR
jgi:uncharacterized protein (TIGR02246 family)